MCLIVFKLSHWHSDCGVAFFHSGQEAITLCEGVDKQYELSLCFPAFSLWVNLICLTLSSPTISLLLIGSCRAGACSCAQHCEPGLTKSKLVERTAEAHLLGDSVSFSLTEYVNQACHSSWLLEKKNMVRSSCCCWSVLWKKTLAWLSLQAGYQPCWSMATN